MAEDFGSGVSRTLSALERAFTAVVWQKGKPPLDSELSLIGQLSNERLVEHVRANMHSGFLTDPTASDRDFVTEADWSNFFKFGRQATGENAPVLWANVHGWIVPVTGSNVSNGDTSNRINLFPPPASDSRIDLVFMEVWQARIAPPASEVNKPTSTTIWRHGNTEFGGTNITDDLEDPVIKYETTERVQLQYALRVYGSGTGLGSSVALDDFPDGLDDPNVLGQAAATAPVGGFTFANMRELLGDPGLWRAGDGVATNALGTVDGYVYAIPVCAIFRRNSQPFRARETAGNANQNGAFDRNPSAVTLTNPPAGAKALTTATLTNAISETTTGVVQITNLVGSGIDDTQLAIPGTFLVIDGEILTLTAVDAGAGTITIPASGGRGRNATMAIPHAAGAAVSFFNTRPDNLFADEIADSDVLELRRTVTAGEWDYQRLLVHNLSALFQGRLRSTWKQSGIGDTQGPLVVEVDTLWATGTVPNQTEALDGPDGIRQIFSDAASLQGDVTVLLDEFAAQTGGFVSPGGFASGASWGIAADFQPGGFMASASTTWKNGTVIDLYIGGTTGNDGARGTFRDSGTRAVRFVSPAEFWLSDQDLSLGLQHPVTLRFINEPSMHPAGPGQTVTEHPGPMYPLRATNFEKPFIVLGGLLNPALKVSGPSVFTGPDEIRLPGLNFDVAGDWWSLDANGDFANDPAALSKPLKDGRRTLWAMLTKDGSDPTGNSSEVYLVLAGDISGTSSNNGCYQVLGAGTSGLTTQDATILDRVRVRHIAAVGAPPLGTPGAATVAQLRSQYTDVEDGSGGASQISAVQIVLTDMEGTTGGTDNPWNAANLAVPIVSGTTTGRVAVRTTLQYNPGRAGMARRPDDVWRLALVNRTEAYLRQPPSLLDSSFPSQAGTPTDETPFDLNPLQAWNRLSSLGLDAPDAPAYGGTVVAFSEQDREAEAFFDSGSKTLLFRPYRNHLMTLKTQSTTPNSLTPTNYLGGYATDALGLFEGSRVVGFPLPPEIMPRFGRVDISYFVDTNPTAAQPTFHEGINHLFVDDAANPSAEVFSIIGGRDNAGGSVGTVLPIYFITGSSSGLLYGQSFTVFSKVGYQGRLYEDVTVQSSDVGRVLKGIQLPPFLGPARIYGIYDRRDFLAAGGTTYQSDRLTRSAGAPPNLMRTDARKQTLFLVEGGAEDATGSALDHTYVIPEELIDIELADAYVSGEVWEDIEFVVECVVFGFARGWVNKNHYVLLRANSGAAVLNPQYNDAADLTLEGVRMVLPSAAEVDDQVSIGYSRIPYQGDPYMTRAGETRTVSDYAHRYGQVTQGNAFELSKAIQQFDSDGNLLVEMPNRRALAVLAHMDFYTTLGTGKVAGPVFAGTITDVGHVDDTMMASVRVPATSADPRWFVASRTFTEGQGVNPFRASVRVLVADNASMVSATLTVRKLDGTDAVYIGVVGAPATPNEFEVGVTAQVTAYNLAVRMNLSTSPTVVEVQAVTDGSAAVTLQARTPGSAGQQLRAMISDTTAWAILIGNDQSPTSVFFRGGDDLVLNAGIGNSSLDLTCLTDRLPLGILVQDSDFLGEDPLNNGHSMLDSMLGPIRALSVALPLTSNGQEYTRLVGGPGQWLGMSDGGILRYAAFNQTTAPTGSKRFRLYRGGGSAFVLTNPNPGGPIDWASGDLPAPLNPVLKGAVLAGKALLVRNSAEEAFASPSTVSHGSELQLVIFTRAVYGKGRESLQTAGQTLAGIVGPTGYGEGYGACDRYRLKGKPLLVGVREPLDVEAVEPAAFPFASPTETTC